MAKNYLTIKTAGEVLKILLKHLTNRQKGIIICIKAVMKTVACCGGKERDGRCEVLRCGKVKTASELRRGNAPAVGTVKAK